MEWLRELLSKEKTFHVLRISSNQNLFLANGCANFLSTQIGPAQLRGLCCGCLDKTNNLWCHKSSRLYPDNISSLGQGWCPDCGTGRKQLDPCCSSLVDGQKTQLLSMFISDQLYTIAPKSSRGKPLGRKINTVQFIFFKMSICFVISYIHRKISAGFFHTICHLRPVFSFLNLASHFKSFSIEKNILTP